MKVWFKAKKVSHVLVVSSAHFWMKKSKFSQIKIKTDRHNTLMIPSGSRRGNWQWFIVIVTFFVRSHYYNGFRGLFYVLILKTKKVGHLALWQPPCDPSKAKGGWCNQALPPGSLFLQTDTVERLTHPVELLLQLRVHGRCGGGSRMWQNNPGITVSGRCMCFFFSRTLTQKEGFM